MKRFLTTSIQDQFARHRQMVILLGPRQSGKTWIAKNLTTQNIYYLSWDNPDQRRLILENGPALVEEAGLNTLMEEPPVVVFDELHKYPKWKDFIKGFYDVWELRCHILITGSASIDAFSRGGDSLMGRYFPWRCHPLTWSEILMSGEADTTKEQEKAWAALLTFGGFPEPFLKRDITFWRRWKNLRWKQLFQEDIRDLSRTLEIQRIEILGSLLLEQVGSQCNWTALANKLKVSQDTIHRWYSHLEALHTVFALRPWSRNISRSLLKEPKVFFTDWSLVQDTGARVENMVASQVRATLHLWEDKGHGVFGLWYLRDKDQREVDFVITKDDTPWIILEVKKADTSLSPLIEYFATQLHTPHNFQLVMELSDVNANPFEKGAQPLIVPARTFFRYWTIPDSGE